MMAWTAMVDAPSMPIRRGNGASDGHDVFWRGNRRRKRGKNKEEELECR